MTDVAAALTKRAWVPQDAERYIQGLAASTANQDADAIEALIAAHTAENRTIHERDCVNNPRAEAALASGLGSRPSLGYPGDKYEMGLEGIEKIEVIAAELAAEVFGALCRDPVATDVTAFRRRFGTLHFVRQ